MGFLWSSPESDKDDENNEYPIVGDDSIMSKKEHGTTDKPVQQKLKWQCDRKTANKICCHNRHFAENSGYWKTTLFLKEIDKNKPITFYDSVSGKPLFIAPKGRTFKQFEEESNNHGWPSFRDAEVVWDNVRCLKNGECVSLGGTHLGHNIPDKAGENRYCINLVSMTVCGYPESK
eukprot:348237_1